jgi:hypothetical protein
MPLEIGLWRVDAVSPVRVAAAGFPLESRLEDLIESDPAILGESLLVVGRQVPTGYGKFIDLLAVSADGTLHVLELKRDRTPRDVVAQILDYGSWVESLSHSEVVGIFNDQHDVAFEVAFADHFGTNPPDELNGAHKLTVVASDVDAATERIITYLNAGFAVPVNVVFFRYFRDDGREYLARTWLLKASATTRPAGRLLDASREPWNGRDWYVSFGEFAGQRSWDDARKYGFISAGGGIFYSRTLRSLPVGARVFVYIPQTGYVGVGITSGEAARFDDAIVTTDDQQRKLAELPLAGGYHHTEADSDETAEYVVSVDWIGTRTREQAIRQKGLFANQNSACKLRNRFTLDVLYSAFGLDDLDPGGAEIRNTAIPLSAGRTKNT